MRKNSLSPPVFPPRWASEWGEDIYGLWTALFYEGVCQIFRWVPSGTFKMGSPEDERGRFDNEKLHEVTISRGFWLADTPVTQALWREVMGDNPSHFTGDDRLPVESVCWDECRRFMVRLNRFHPELRLDFPTEAQWEYACRAGKDEEPFSFGQEISLELANYRGTWDDWGNWSKGAKKQTSPVGSYPCNGWGLYDMHGNILERCLDWYGGYPDGPVEGQIGPKRGVYRVLRGGSWIDGGRYCRSARRRWFDPGLRYDFLGFRLSLGQGP